MNVFVDLTLTEIGLVVLLTNCVNRQRFRRKGGERNLKKRKENWQRKGVEKEKKQKSVDWRNKKRKWSVRKNVKKHV